MNVLCDIGGTHIRMAFNDGSADILEPVKLPAVDFKTFQAAVEHYFDEKKLDRQSPVLVATTGETFRPWPLDKDNLVKQGINIRGLVNDFEASAWGAPRLQADGLITLRAGTPQNREPRVILGPGTGLGFAYMTPLANDKWHIQKTHGGHMHAALINEEHILLADIMTRARSGRRMTIYEDFACGRGLPHLYRAVCSMLGQRPEDIRTAEGFLKLVDDPSAKETLRVFHEMLGIFAHNAVLMLNAFGGVYLDGGMIHRLRDKNLFDAETVMKFMMLDPVPSVRQDLENVPVWIVNDPFIALRGLTHMQQAGMFP